MSLTLALAAAAAIQPRIVDTRDPVDDERLVAVYIGSARPISGLAGAIRTWLVDWLTSKLRE